MSHIKGHTSFESFVDPDRKTLLNCSSCSFSTQLGLHPFFNALFWSKEGASVEFEGTLATLDIITLHCCNSCVCTSIIGPFCLPILREGLNVALQPEVRSVVELAALELELA